MIRTYLNHDPMLRIKGPWTGYGATRSWGSYKKVLNPVCSFLHAALSPLFVFSLRRLENPNPSYPKSVQTHARSSLIALSCCSAHQLNTRNFETHEIGVILVAVANRSDSSLSVFLALNLRGSSRIRNGFHSL